MKAPNRSDMCQFTSQSNANNCTFTPDKQQVIHEYIDCSFWLKQLFRYYILLSAGEKKW